ncbi:MAG: C4-dicarboxylic acid transporter DauA [Verrucomicrobiota bacterium]
MRGEPAKGGIFSLLAGYAGDRRFGSMMGATTHLGHMSNPSLEITEGESVPVGSLSGMVRYLRYDLPSGFLVFLIALPLCLGISVASGCPAVAGILTAVIGGLLTPFFSNSELTIKGPAAGMIAIVLGAVTAFTPEAGGGADAGAVEGYRKMLGVAVVAGGVQVLLGAFRLGVLGEFFPLAAVHGMLAAIGVIIISKQAHVVLLGVPMKGEPFHLLAAIPESFRRMDHTAGMIGLVGVAILFVRPWLKWKVVQRVPGPIWVLLFGVPTAMALGVPERQLVHLPSQIAGALTLPDFSGVFTGEGMKWVLMFAMVGSLESLLSAKAIDLLDPWKRRTDLNKDLLAVGIANTAGALVGALPMISEIVRSSANRSNGARTRWANFFHGLCLLVMVAVVPGLLNHIPLSALAAMLVFTGFNLASPKEFFHMYHTGRGEFVVFLTTLVVTLATDLLVGIGAGVLMQWVVLPGALAGNPFRARCEVSPQGADGLRRVVVRGALMFSNWMSFSRQLGAGDGGLVLDVSGVEVLDHSVMKRLAELQESWADAGRVFRLEGVNQLHAVSSDPLAERRARK